MTTQRRTTTNRRPRKAAAKPTRPTTPSIPRNESGRAVASTRQTETLAIPENRVGILKAALKTGWLGGIPLLGALFGLATYTLLPPLAIVIVAVVTMLIPVPVFLAIWSKNLMPVMRLELNDHGDRYQLRIYYTPKADYGAEGKFRIFGSTGYAVDGLETKDHALTVFHQPENYETTAPESLRYLCDHTPSREKYRRKAANFRHDLIQWGSIITLVSILAGLSFIIGNRNY